MPPAQIRVVVAVLLLLLGLYEVNRAPPPPK